MHLTHRQLEIFRSLMHTLSVTETAAQLLSSQPTISRELKALEAELGFQLFRRERRRLEVTAQAIAFNVVVQRSFVSLGEVGRAAHAIRGDRLQRVSVACLPAFAHALMPGVVRRFLQSFPDASLKIHSLEETALTRELLGTIFDVGIVEGGIAGGAGSITKLPAGNLVCILPAGHPLAQYEVVEPAQISEFPFIYYSEEDSYRRQIDAQFDEIGASRRLMMETTTATSIGAMVCAGIGISIVNPLTALAFEGKNLIVRPLAKTIPYNLQLWQPDVMQPSQLGNSFIEATTATVDAFLATLKVRRLV